MAASASREAHQAERVLSQLDAVPSLASIAESLVGRDPAFADLERELIQHVSSDPSLASRVVSLLESDNNAVSHDAAGVENAVTRLGPDTVRRFVVAASVMDAFSGGELHRESNGLNRPAFWRHSLAVGCAARRLAEVVPQSISREEAFDMGLLHDIGKAALDAALPKSYARVLRQADRARGDVAEFERGVLGVDHTLAGRYVAERWGLPPRLVQVIWLHHLSPNALPASVAAGRQVEMIQLADAIVRERRIGYSGNHRIVPALHDLAGALGVSAEALHSIAESTANESAACSAWVAGNDPDSDRRLLHVLRRRTDELSSANAALSLQNRRLQREAEYFAAVGWLDQSLSRGSSVREVCGAAAVAIRRALGLRIVLVIAGDGHERWLSTGLSDQGTISQNFFESGHDADRRTMNIATAVQLARSGVWIAAPGGGFDDVVDRWRSRLGADPVWLLPIVDGRGWVAGAFFSAPAEAVVRLRVESPQIAMLAASVGKTIAQAQRQTAIRTLSDALVQANSRQAAAQGELIRTCSLEAIVAMAAGAAHELNNPLAVISGRAQMLRAQADSENLAGHLDAIIRQAHAASDIVSDLMEFARPGPQVPQSVSLQNVLSALRTELISAGLLAAEQWVLDVPSDTPPVWFDPTRLMRLFRELVDNARQAASSDSLRLTVKARRDLSEEFVVMQVSDNGRGMTSEVLGRAMDPFFSHRAAGRGRGLGLARVARWLAEGGGSISVASTPGHGTCVELRLPIAPRL